MPDQATPAFEAANNVAVTCSTCDVVLRVCQLECDVGRYGVNCSSSCDCHGRDTTCDSITGRCHCPSGRTGHKCHKSKSD